MFGWIAIRKDESEVFVESTNVEELALGVSGSSCW